MVLLSRHSQPEKGAILYYLLLGSFTSTLDVIYDVSVDWYA